MYALAEMSRSFSAETGSPVSAIGEVSRHHHVVDVVARHRRDRQAQAAEALRKLPRARPGARGVGRAHVGDDRDASFPTCRQDGLQATLEHRVEPARRILRARLLRQRDRPLGEALENQIIERAVRRELDGRLNAIAGVPGAAANPHGLHNGNTPNTTHAIVMTTDAANR